MAGLYSCVLCCLSSPFTVVCSQSFDDAINSYALNEQPFVSKVSKQPFQFGYH